MNPRLILGRYPRRDDRCLHPDYPQWRSGFPGFPEALSPAVLAMTPKGAYFANIAAIIAAMAVSFVVSAVLLKTSKVKEEDDIEAATRRMHDMKAESKGASPLAAGNVTNDLSHVRKIIVACDAGMGSSAMGAGVLRKKVQDAGLSNISVTNSAINNLPPDVDSVITHRDLTERAMRRGAAGAAYFADQLPRQRSVHQPDRAPRSRPSATSTTKSKSPIA